MFAALVLAGLGLQASPVGAIPAFARKYRVTCSLCHAPAPRLNAFGEQFAANGFAFAPNAEPVDTIQTGDPLLVLPASVPLAFRVDAYLQALTEAESGEARSDLGTPYAIKLLSGGQITSGVSYYLYFFLSEQGEVAGLEDAYIQFTDLFGSGVALLAGQFQVSDPLFKRELRLEFEDYQIYRVRVGETRADLTYDRGLMAVYSPWSGGDLSVQLLNGRGLTEASEARQYDRDAWKNVALRYSHDLGPFRLGVFGYVGTEELDAVQNRFTLWGPDATIALSPSIEVNLQYLRRKDDDPFYGEAGRPVETVVDGGFGEVVWGPGGPTGRVFLTGLVNWVRSDEPVFLVRQGESAAIEAYTSAAAGVSYLLQRNLRILGEVQYDLERERARLTTGVSVAF
jgi:hypothetical protein